MSRTLLASLCSVAAAMLASAALLTAGPLSPPPGAPASSYKTLSEVEPRIAINDANTPGDNDSTPSRFKITQPGSYYLTGNLQGVSGKIGIEIVASNVTIDLGGFELAGVAGSLDGVATTLGSLRNVSVLNGSVTGWGSDGVDLFSFAVTGGRVHAVQTSANAGVGFRLGLSFAITDCAADTNGVGGFVSSSACSFTGCIARNNGGAGFASAIGCAYTNCTARDNTGSGFSASSGSTLTGCVATSNVSSGIFTAGVCSLLNCAAYLNDADGIITGNGSTVTNCTATSNGGVGISVGNVSIVVDCNAAFNTSNGIAVSQNCTVRGNLCGGNGSGTGDGAGILATGSDNRIEGNTCLDNDRGIDINTSGNIIIRNTCSGNTTNWDIAAGNAVAPIVQASTNAAAILGSTYSGALSSTDPNANFSY